MISSYKVRTAKGNVYHQKKDLTLKQNVYQENGQSIKNDYVNSMYKEILIDNAAIIIRDDTLNDRIFMDLKYDHSFIKLHFVLEGDCIFTPKTTDGKEIVINKNQFNFFYLPKVNGTLSLNKKENKSLEIMISEDYLQNLFKEGFEHICGGFGNAIKNKIPFRLFEHSESIPSNLLVIINEIISCSFRKEIKKIYLDSKVKEIFSYLLLILNDKQRQPEINLNEQDLNLIITIKQILNENLIKSPTIRELASLYGTNETKLKRNFKLVTGKPIFTYLTDLRMEKAKHLLMDKNISISDVAFTVGYKNPQHFTSAFKRKYNYVPSEYKSSVIKK